MHLLEVRDLQTVFQTDGKRSGQSTMYRFSPIPGEIVAFVGESGSGKSVTQMSILKLVEEPGKIVGGEVLYNGRNILAFDDDSPEMRKIRGGEIGMIFQEPMTSLNPVITIGKQITEMIAGHSDSSREKALEKAIALLGSVGIPDAEKRINDYPHQFSGGMRQRIMIAMAMAAEPKILIADEATVVEDGAVAVGSDGHGLIPLTGDVLVRILDGEVHGHEVGGADGQRGAVLGAQLLPVGADGAGAVVPAEDGRRGILAHQNGVAVVADRDLLPVSSGLDVDDVGFAVVGAGRRWLPARWCSPPCRPGPPAAPIRRRAVRARRGPCLRGSGPNPGRGSEG